MFFLKTSEAKRLAKECGHWLRLADKVRDYRRDILSAEQSGNLDEAVSNLEKEMGSDDNGRIRKAINQLEKTLRTCGGSFYPHSHWAENVEMFLVAAILAIGIRSYFIQPFKIPTNSMYPSYHGMTYYVYNAPDASDRPNMAERVIRKAVYGASFKHMEAPASGELVIPLPNTYEELQRNQSNFRYKHVRGFKWFILPTTLKEFTFYVGGRPVSVRVPADFDFDRLALSRFTSNGPDEKAHWDPEVHPTLGRVIRPDIHFEKGDTVLAFDILTGDALFVDRITYHFVRPKIGDPFVFRTDNIPGIGPANRGKYYIKRLVGMGGDELRVDFPVLYRNGKPIEGAEAFALNANREGEYEGYTNKDSLGSPADTIKIPDKHYFAMGDNSDQSSDGRSWGFVPEEDVVGKALFIYYPFTRRWGPSD